MSNAAVLKEYQVGDSDKRPWGSYVVTAVWTNDKGEEVCEKDITVEPGKILSLQSHKFRRENWKVTQGTLTVVLDDRRIELQAGENIDIPLEAIHCMANLKDAPCVVHEIQEGLCREEDIIRYVDSYGRGTESVAGGKGEASVALYREIMKEIEAAAKKAA